MSFIAEGKNWGLQPISTCTWPIKLPPVLSGVYGVSGYTSIFKACTPPGAIESHVWLTAVDGTLSSMLHGEKGSVIQTG